MLQALRIASMHRNGFNIHFYCHQYLATITIALYWSKMAEFSIKKQALYLPPEVWQRVFFQHTDPESLWTAGRQVCSMWRSEIAKVFAKKYLENPDMVQIYFDCGIARIEGANCMMGAEMVF